MQQRPMMLEGLKVLDFTQYVAGPTVTKLMAELGAEIIKVEIAPNGDLSRNFPYIRDKRSAYFVQQNRGKQSLCLDTKSEAGRKIIRDLVPKVDVMVQNYAPGVIARMGLSYDVVQSLNPGIIMCSVSTFGQSGPLADAPGYDFIGQSYAGVTWLSGEDGGPHYPPMLAVGDVSTGVHAYGAVMTALLYRERTGLGQHIDISLLDSYFHYQDMAIEAVTSSRGDMRVQRIGGHVSALAPCGMYPTATGYLWIMAFQDNHWASLCNLMGRADLITDSRTNSNQGRITNREVVHETINRWLGGLPDRDAAIAALREARIPHAPVLSPEEAMAHPHMRERGTVRTIHDRLLGDFSVPGFPFRFSGFPEQPALDAPFLGEHNRSILENYLGYSGDRIAELETAGVLHSAPY